MPIVHTLKALDFVEAIPPDRWIIVKNETAKSMRDLVDEYNRRNPWQRVKILYEDAESKHDVRVKRDL
jgi:hypothetical protein